MSLSVQTSDLNVYQKEETDMFPLKEMIKTEHLGYYIHGSQSADPEGSEPLN